MAALPPANKNDVTANAKDVAKATHELGRTIVTLLLKEPFYGHLLGGLVRRISDDVPTAAVALTPKGPELIVNPLFFIKELKTKERVAVIKHEALHIILDTFTASLKRMLTLNCLISPRIWWLIN